MDKVNTIYGSASLIGTVHTVIVGAGVAGLTCARQLTYLLKKREHRITVLEARDRVGGRTCSIPELNLDIGASWNFPHHIATRSLAQELNISTIEQYESGISLMNTGSSGVQRMNIESGCGDLKRLKGGTGSLCAAMLNEITTQLQRTVTVQLNSPVKEIVHQNDQTIVLTLRDNRSILADYVVLALPPKLLISTIQLTPPLPSSISKQLSECITWMGSTCKIILVYDCAWWRDENLSGFAISRGSRAQEWHDASSDTCNGLFAFCMPGTTKQQMIDDTVQVFGKKAQNPIGVYMIDWSQEQFTSHSQNDGIDGHRHMSDACRKALWKGRLWLGNSEVSDRDAGVLEGAVRRGTDVAEQLAAMIPTNN